MLQSIFV